MRETVSGNAPVVGNDHISAREDKHGEKLYTDEGSKEKHGAGRTLFPDLCLHIYVKVRNTRTMTTIAPCDDAKVYMNVPNVG